MLRTDVLIVGGGPAGSSCAWQLRRHGLDVVVMDRASFPRDKVCAGWVTPQVVEALALDLRDYARERVVQPIGGFLTGGMRGPLLETRFDGVVSYAIRRCEFDDYLLQRCGARLHTGEPLQSLERVGGEWIANGAVGARMLIGAGGYACPVARHLSRKADTDLSLVAAREAEVPLGAGAGCAVRADTPELYFCDDLEGYGWCVRKGDWLNIGLGRRDRHRLPEHLDRFRQALVRDGRIPDLPTASFRGHAYLLYGHQSRPLVSDAALLIGDAAGLAYPASGEGIRPAVESGMLAAQVIAAAWPRVDTANLDAYRALLTQRLGTPPRPAARGGRLKPWLASRLLRNRWFTRRQLLERDFLHRAAPPLHATDVSTGANG